MLNDILKEEEKFFFNRTYYKALNNLSPVINSIGSKQKYRFIFPLKESGLSLMECRGLSYNISNYMWKSCENQSERSKGRSKLY